MKKYLLLILLPLSSFSQKNYPALLDSFMQGEVLVNKFNGNVLVAREDKVIYQKSFGYRNYDTKELLDNNSLFELASVSKQFTAMGILMLKEKGLLQLNDSLRKFFPELPYHNITIKHLLTHTSGLPDYMEAMSTKWDHSKVAFNEDVIRFLASENVPIDFKPGERCIYSNTAYEMLASIIEKVTGKTYAEFLQTNIFRPLDMNLSRTYNTRRSVHEVIPNYAYGFVYSDSLKRYVMPDSLPSYDYVVYLDGIQGDGIVNSTTGDLYKWDRALKNHKLLSAATQAEMFTPYSLFDTSSKIYYGYGEFLGNNEIGKYIAHSGGWPGYRTYLIRYPKSDITVIILSNNESSSSLLAGALAYVITDRSYITPYIHKVASIDNSVLRNYVGEYHVPSTPESADFLISTENGKLYYQSKNQPNKIELLPESANKFFVSGQRDMQVEFQTNSSGKLLRSYVIYHGMKKEMIRLKDK